MWHRKEILRDHAVGRVIKTFTGEKGHYERRIKRNFSLDPEKPFWITSDSGYKVKAVIEDIFNKGYYRFCSHTW